MQIVRASTYIFYNYITRGHSKGDGDFSISSKYRRKRLDYDIYDEVGCGHELHQNLFEEEFRDRTNTGPMIFVNDSDKNSDVVSLGSTSTRLTQRKSSTATNMRMRGSNFPSLPGGQPRLVSNFPTLPRNSSFQQGVKENYKKKPTFQGTARKVSQGLMAFPIKESTVGASFPVVPDSPPFIAPEAKQFTLRQVIIIRRLKKGDLTLKNIKI